MTTPNKVKLKLDIPDEQNMALLAEKYPDAVKKVVEVRHDQTRLYELAKAHLVIGLPIPGVCITTPEGRVLDGTQGFGTLAINREGNSDAAA